MLRALCGSPQLLTPMIAAVLIGGCPAPTTTTGETGDNPAGDNQNQNGGAANVENSNSDTSANANSNDGGDNANANANTSSNQSNENAGSAENSNSAPGNANDNGTGPTSQSITIEPDDHADETELTTISPHVTLTTADTDNVIFDSFAVTASVDNLDLAPTGQQVFGHANIPFFNNDRRLRMDFTAPAESVSIRFGGGTFFDTEIGRLRAYDEAGNLLEEVVTGPISTEENVVVTITRGTAEIAWAVAFIAENEGSFGRLDELTFTLPPAQLRRGR